MKKAIITVVVILFSFLILACEKEDLHNKVFAESLLVLAEGDTENKITQDFVILTQSKTVKEAQLTWLSTNPEVITIEGQVAKVKRQANDANVILILKVSINKEVKEQGDPILNLMTTLCHR